MDVRLFRGKRARKAFQLPGTRNARSKARIAFWLVGLMVFGSMPFWIPRPNRDHPPETSGTFEVGVGSELKRMSEATEYDCDLAGGCREKWKAGGSSKPIIGIKIHAFHGVRSLERLLVSLLHAEYDGAYVPISFRVEGDRSSEMMESVEDFRWPHGSKQVDSTHEKGDLLDAVLKDWSHSLHDEMYILLEDNVEVSPFFYTWTKGCIRGHAHLNVADDHLAGIGLCTPRAIRFEPPRHLYRSSESLSGWKPTGLGAFRLQLVGGCGVLLFPHFWAELHAYVSLLKRKATEPKETKIPRSSLTDRRALWRDYANDLIWYKDFYLIYPDLFNKSSFSSNVLGMDDHIKHSTFQPAHEDYTVPLIADRDMTQMALAWTKDSTWSSLPLLDMYGSPVQSWGQVKSFIGDFVPPEDARKTDTCTEEILLASCSLFNPEVSRFLSADDKFTVVISFFWTAERKELLNSLIELYAKTPLVDKIFVVWHNHLVPCPLSTILNNVKIHFSCQVCNSLNNRFLLDMRITTRGVLIVDDDIQVHPHDLENLFHTWQLHKDRIVGFFPRWFQPLNETFGQYGVNPALTEHKRGYSFMLTKRMMVHANYLYEYRCGLGLKLHKHVDAFVNGEDLAFNVMVGKLLGRMAPLFLEPFWPIVDYGTHSREGIHQRSKQHRSGRNAVVQASIAELQMTAWDLCCEDLYIQFDKESGQVLEQRVSSQGAAPYIYSPCKYSTNASACKKLIPFSLLDPINRFDGPLLT